MSWDVSNGLKLTLQGDTNWGPCLLPNWFQTRLPQRQTLSIKYFSFLAPNEGTICQEQAATFSCQAAPELPSTNMGLVRGAWPLSLAGKDEDSNPNQRDDLCAGQHRQAKAQLCQDDMWLGSAKDRGRNHFLLLQLWFVRKSRVSNFIQAPTHQERFWKVWNLKPSPNYSVCPFPLHFSLSSRRNYNTKPKVCYKSSFPALSHFQHKCTLHSALKHILSVSQAL